MCPFRALGALEQAYAFHLVGTFVLPGRCTETVLTGSLMLFRILPPGARHVLIQLVAFAITCPPQSLLALCWKTPSMPLCT